MGNIINVRCGATPDDSKLPYKFTTTEIATFLQSKFDFIEHGVQKKLKELGKDPSSVPHIKVRVLASEIGPRFVPLTVILPDSVLYGKSSDDSIPSIFRPDNEDEGVRIQKEYFGLLSRYMYSPDDRKAFKAPDWRRVAGVRNVRLLNDVAKYSTPKIEKFETKTGEAKCVLVLIDPSRILHDMLTNTDNPNQRFRVWIEDCKRIDDSDHCFEVTREVTKRGANDSQDIVKSVRKMMTRGAQRR